MSAQFTRQSHRAREAMLEVGRAYPQAWETADLLRQGRGRDLPLWPDHVYLPLHAAYAIVSGGGSGRVPLDRASHVGVVGALATWRMTQGIYRFDPDLRAALAATDLDREIPIEVLRRLPEWCVYLETPGLDLWGSPVEGAWVHWDWEQGGSEEIRIVLDGEGPDVWARCLPVPLLVTPGATVADAYDRAVASAVHRVSDQTGTQEDVDRARSRIAGDPGGTSIAPTLGAILSLALYLVSQGAEISGRRGDPANPQPKRTRHQGWRLFAADGPTVWDVGVRLGAALRAAGESEGSSETTGRHVRGHIRRAHWHTYVLGPRDAPEQQRREVRWMPPIAVALDDIGELPSTIRQVH